jgi:hypothetical protein
MFPKLMPLQDGPPLVDVTVIVVDAVFVESCVEAAVIVAVPVVLGGVKVTAVPETTLLDELSVPPPDGLMERFTVLVNEPVPVTVGVQVAVCAVVMLLGVQTSETPVMVGPADETLMFAEPKIFVYPVAEELALHVAVPAPEGVKRPADVMVPPVADHVTAEL